MSIPLLALLALHLGHAPATPGLGAVPSDQPDFKGRPSQFKAGQTTGVAVWTDPGAIRMRFSAGKQLRHYSGKVCTRGTISTPRPFHLESTDEVKVDGNAKCIHFKLRVQADVDGFAFNATGPFVIFDLRSGRKALAPQEIWIGASGQHPSDTPFILQQQH
jgi:hypothetical protein